jgi:hypothetical protein
VRAARSREETSTTALHHGHPPLSRTLHRRRRLGATAEARAWCPDQILPRATRIFTPRAWRIAGARQHRGAHWGGVAADAPPDRGRTRQSRSRHRAALRLGIRRNRLRRGGRRARPHRLGIHPHGRHALRPAARYSSGLPACLAPPPFGSLVAVSLETGRIGGTFRLARCRR